MNSNTVNSNTTNTPNLNTVNSTNQDLKRNRDSIETKFPVLLNSDKIVINQFLKRNKIQININNYCNSIFSDITSRVLTIFKKWKLHTNQ